MFKKPTSKSAETAIPEVLGAVAGYMVSNAILEGINKPVAESETQEVKDKASSMRQILSGGMIAVAVIGLCAVNGSDVKTSIVKGMLTGTTVAQSRNIINAQASKSATLQAKLKDETKVLNRMYKGALGCPCDANSGLGYVSLNAPKRYRKGMKGTFDVSPFYQPQFTIQSPSESQSAITNWRSVA